MKLIVVLTIGCMFCALAQGLVELGGFKTPSGNIHCAAYRDTATKQAELRCDLLRNEAKLPPRPRDCELDWGNAFAMSDRGKAGRICHGDTVANPQYPTLAYGQSWSAGGFKCSVTSTRLRCVNRDGKGWELSRTRQILF